MVPQAVSLYFGCNWYEYSSQDDPKILLTVTGQMGFKNYAKKQRQE